MFKKTKLCSVFLIFLFCSYFAIAAQTNVVHLTTSTEIFDAQRLAASETHMWRAYYNKDYVMLANSIVQMLMEQFQLPFIEATLVSFDATQAARQFSEIPARASQLRYEKEVLPSLIKFYIKLRNIFGARWDPVEVARAELAWWVARRTPGKNKPQQVGVNISQLYELLYGKTNAHIQQAGLLRAQAAYLRDIQSRRGKIDWARIQKMLEQSYRYLLLGITNNPNTATEKK